MMYISGTTPHSKKILQKVLTFSSKCAMMIVDDRSAMQPNLYLCAIVIAIQSHSFFALEVSLTKEYNLVMIVHKYMFVVSGFSPTSNNKMQLHQLVHCLDHSLTLHAGLLCNVIVAVPTVVQ